MRTVRTWILLGVVGLGCGGDDVDATDEGAATAGPPRSAAEGPATPDDDPCIFPADAGRSTGPVVEGRTSVGDFLVDVGSLGGGGALTVRHRSEMDKVLFATPEGRVVRAARPRLRVEEHQGSFSIDDRDEASCDSARLTGMTTAGGRLVLHGALGSATPCAEVSFNVGVCQARAGHLVVDVQVSDPAFSAVTLETTSAPDEKIYGLGEQFAHQRLDLKGRRIPILAQEGGVGRGHGLISPVVNKISRGSAGNEATTYYAAPHVLTSRRRSFFLENIELAQFDFTAPNRIAVRTHAPHVRLRVLAGKTPLELVERFTEYAGRMPRLPDWVHEGAIVAIAREPEEGIALLDALRAHGAKIAGLWNQTWSGKAKSFIGEQVLWNWAHNPARYPGWQAYADALAERNVKLLCYVNPMFREVPAEAQPIARDIFREGLAEGAFILGENDKPLMLPVTAFDVALLDLSKPSARTWMKRVIKEEMIDKAHCRGWMADFAEALPFEAKLGSGATGAAYHNAYPVEWANLQRELLRENGLLGDILVFNRSGHTKTPSSSILLWEGDQLTTWDEEDGLVSALHGLLNGGLSGISLNHSDTGGYTSLSVAGLGFTRERELLHRWTEMNAFTAVLRTHEGNQPGANAQVYDEDGIAHFARMTKVYRALAPYRRHLVDEAAEKGWPVVRHLLLQFPDDPKSWEVDDEMMLGSEILVAPTTTKCVAPPFCTANREVYLPPGRWVHVWTGDRFGDSARGTNVKVKAPVGKPAVFHREGSADGEAFVAKLKEQLLL